MPDNANPTLPAAQMHVMPDGTRIAWIADGTAPGADSRSGTFWLGGFKSDMRGTKAERIYREVKVMMIGGGAEEIMKDLAARQLGL